MTVRTYAPGEVVVSAGSSMWYLLVIVSGVVKVERTSELLPPVIGADLLLTNQPVGNTLAADPGGGRRGLAHEQGALLHHRQRVSRVPGGDDPAARDRPIGTGGGAMKIATQNLILIAPIFLALAVITAFVLFVSERREVRWGLDSEAQGVALTIAEFTRASTLAALPGETPKDREARLRPPIDRVLKFGHARRVELFVMEAGQPHRILDIGERAGTPPSIDPDTLDRVIDGGVPVDDAPGASDRQAAYAPIRTGSQVHGVVVVEASLAPLFAHRHEMIFLTAAIAVGLLGIGCLVSLIISRIISGEIGRLTRTAEAFVAGAYDARLERGAIEEVAVVGSTFGIMGSVLKDATLRSTREMVQLERFSTETDLGVSFAERFARPIAEERGGLAVAIDRIGPSMYGDFWFVASSATTTSRAWAASPARRRSSRWWRRRRRRR